MRKIDLRPNKGLDSVTEVIIEGNRGLKLNMEMCTLDLVYGDGGPLECITENLDELKQFFQAVDILKERAGLENEEDPAGDVEETGSEKERLSILCSRIIDLGDKTVFRDVLDELDVILDDMAGEDRFGTAGQNDPRGDGRDGAWCVWRMQGVDG